MTTIYFVRHGQSEANIKDVFAGWSDSPLTDLGLRQAECTAECLKGIPFTAVYTSDLQRARVTGEKIAGHHGLSVICHEGLRELNLGDWELQPYHMPEDDPTYWTWKHRLYEFCAPGGETIEHLQKRMQAAVKSIVRNHPGETVCITTHATPIRVIEPFWAHTPNNELDSFAWVSNASYSVVRYSDDGECELLARDVHDHLQGKLYTKLSENA